MYYKGVILFDFKVAMPVLPVQPISAAEHIDEPRERQCTVTCTIALKRFVLYPRGVRTTSNKPLPASEAAGRGRRGWRLLAELLGGTADCGGYRERSENVGEAQAPIGPLPRTCYFQLAT